MASAVTDNTMRSWKMCLKRAHWIYWWPMISKNKTNGEEGARDSAGKEELTGRSREGGMWRWPESLALKTKWFKGTIEWSKVKNFVKMLFHLCCSISPALLFFFNQLNLPQLVNAVIFEKWFSLFSGSINLEQSHLCIGRELILSVEHISRSTSFENAN